MKRVDLPAGPAHDLREMVYRLYMEAGRPRLDGLAATIANDDTLPGSPKKDLISAIISGATLASSEDVVTVAVVLARTAERSDTAVVAEQVRRLWIAAQTAPPVLPPVRMGRPVGECDPLVLEVHPAIHRAREPIPPILATSRTSQYPQSCIADGCGLSPMRPAARVLDTLISA